MAYDVFVSHHKADREWVSQLVDALSQRSFQIWSPEEPTLGGDLEPQVREALRESDCVVFVITPESVKSRQIAMELGAAWLLQKPVVPIVAGDTPPDDLVLLLRNMGKELPIGDPGPLAEEIVRRVTAKRKNGELN